MSVAMALLYILEFYVLLGLCVAIAFVSFGVTRVLSPPIPATFGARILFVPAATALWPYVVYRWISGSRR